MQPTPPPVAEREVPLTSEDVLHPKEDEAEADFAKQKTRLAELKAALDEQEISILRQKAALTEQQANLAAMLAELERRTGLDVAPGR